MNLAVALVAVLGILTPTQTVAQAETKPEIALVAEYTPQTQETPPRNDLDQKYVESRIREEFDERMVKIVRCESGFRQFKDNGEILIGHTNDWGVMQINVPTWLEKSKELGFDITTLEGNIAMGKYILKAQGYEAWVCDKMI